MHRLDGGAVAEGHPGILGGFLVGQAIDDLQIGQKIHLRQVAPQAGQLILAVVGAHKDRIDQVAVAGGIEVSGAHVPARAVAGQLVVGRGGAVGNELPRRGGPVVSIIQGLLQIDPLIGPVVVQAIRKQFIEIVLPAVVHIVPAAAEGDREHFLFDQQLGQDQIEIVPALFEAEALVPPEGAVLVIVGPLEGMIMQRQLVAVLSNAITVIFFHQVHGDGIGVGHIGIASRRKNTPAHHPPGQLHRLAVGVDQLIAEGRVHHPVGIASRIGVEPGMVIAMVAGHIHAIPDGGVRAQYQVHFPAGQQTGGKQQVQ